MNFMNKNLPKLFFLLLLFVLVLPFLSFAQQNPPTCSAPQVLDTTTNSCVTSVQIVNPINATSLNDFIKEILQGVIKIGIPVIALAIIYAGFLFVKAQGNEKELQTAKNALMYTLIGAAILLGAWALAELISTTVLSL